MVLFKRLSFGEISQKLSESTLAIGGTSLSSFDFDFEKGSTFAFEKDSLVEKHHGTMTLYKKDGTSKSFPMTRESFYPLSRGQSERMQPAYEVLVKEGYSDSLWKIYDRDSDIDKTMLELIERFHEELLIVKEQKMPNFLFTYDDDVHTDMAKFMLFSEGGVEDVYASLSNKYV